MEIHTTTLLMVERILQTLNLYCKIHTSKELRKITLELWRTIYNYGSWRCYQQRPLTLSCRRSLSYRNQSIDLLRKSMDWFLYDNGLHHEWVKLSSWQQWYYRNYSKSSYCRTKFTRKYEQCKYRLFRYNEGRMY